MSSPINQKHPLFWLWIWFGFAAVMLILVILTHAEYKTIGLCFFAWCGGVLSTLMAQEQIERKRFKASENYNAS